MKTVYICFPEGKAKALTLSYDDGRIQDKRLVEIFDKNGIRGTFNLNSVHLFSDAPDRIHADEAVELYKNHEVATHTMTHPTISRIPLTQAAEEILEDRKNLERVMGYPVRGHAYPNGSHNEALHQLFAGLGIAYGRVVGDSHAFELPTDPMQWMSTCHHNNERLMEHARFFADFQKKQYLKLMYVWGHSYEFDDNDNWNVIEEFCEFMGGREDIWYATNIEIIQFMEDADRLQFMADRSAVFNPSSRPVWLSVDGEIVKAEPGVLTKLF